MTVPSRPSGAGADAALRAQYAARLSECGIAVPPGRFDGVIADIIELRGFVELLNAACPDDAEPATLFGNGR